MSNNRLSFGKKHRNNLDTWLHFPATSCSSKCWAGGRADKLHGGIPESFCKYKYNNKCKHKCKQLLLRQIFSSSWKCSIQLTFIRLNECLWVYGAENPQIAQKQNYKPSTYLHLFGTSCGQQLQICSATREKQCDLIIWSFVLIATFMLQARKLVSPALCSD